MSENKKEVTIVKWLLIILFLIGLGSCVHGIVKPVLHEITCYQAMSDGERRAYDFEYGLRRDKEIRERARQRLRRERQN